MAVGGRRGRAFDEAEKAFGTVTILVNNGHRAARHLLTFQKRLTDLGAAVFAGSPADFGKFIAGEIEKWRKVVKFAGIIRWISGPIWIPAGVRDPIDWARHHLSDCINITPTTVPTMYMAQAERLNWVLVELNMKYSPRSAIPKPPAAASFAT
jgi:hypothetical protein